jgi:hypothetical protein
VTRVPRRLPRSVSTRCCHAAAALTRSSQERREAAEEAALSVSSPLACKRLRRDRESGYDESVANTAGARRFDSLEREIPRKGEGLRKGNQVQPRRPKLEVDCGPHASFLCSQKWRTEGEPGAHVLAVVPAHRGTYAEVRGRCWLQISSRHALQKQRSDESEREPRWVAVPGFSRGSLHRRTSATPRSGGQRPLRGGRPRVAS